MTELVLQEGGLPVESTLDRGVVVALVAAGVASVAPLGSDRWSLRAARKVGVVRLGDLTIWVKPKITVSRLLWLLGWTRRAVFDAPGPVALQEADDLVTVIAEAFCSQAEKAVRAGVLQGYQDVEASEAVLRGRLRAGDQLRRRFGLAVPLLVRFDDFLVDIPENQVLKAAVSCLLTLPGVSPSIRGRLRALRGLLVEVKDLSPGSPLPAWHATRLNARYHDALWFATVILAGRSVDHQPGQLRLDGFLIDLYQVFEDFVTDTLGQALTRIAGCCQAQDHHTLDDGGLIEIRPDLVWRVGGHAAAVIDAKYKAEKPAGFPQADLYQALAYATAYGLDEAHLVYAAGNEVANGWTVRHAGIRIVAHTLDLEQKPVAIVGQVEALARGIATPLAVA